jgi:polysaccharide export outer membrane protein
VDAAGYPPGVLAQQLQTRFKDYVNLPVVTVSLEEPAPLHVSVVGEVARPGLYTLDSGARVLEALAQSGGLTEFAHKDRVFVLRGVPPVRVRFSWEMLQHGDPPAAAFRLRTGDAVVVE